jgi:ferredoxin
MKARVKEWLKSGQIDVFIGYKSIDGHPLPYAFTKDSVDEIDLALQPSMRYPIESLAAAMAAKDPSLRIGILGRDCSQRALNVLGQWNQLPTDRITVLTENCCPAGGATPSDCSYLAPHPAGLFKKLVGVDPGLSPEAVDQLRPEERFSRWMYEFQKCIKCYGCRNICPVCFCTDCSLEHAELIGTGELPPEVPIFHLVRAAHMAGRCIDCGLCEEACPAEIPLRLLYRKVNAIVFDLFDFRAGVDEGRPPLSIIGNGQPPPPMTLESGSAPSAASTGA